MTDFQTSLLREKFTITEKPSAKGKQAKPTIALSNRIIIPFVSPDGLDNETFIIRTQNMHSCARLAAAISKELMERGTIAHRAMPVPWKEMWSDIIKGYERDWNSDIWCAVYHNGRIVYGHGERHPFLDIIEQCDIANKGEYGQSVSFAEKAFSQAGKDVSINHDSNIALVVSCSNDKAKCGVIVRAASGTTTFNYTATKNTDHPRPLHAYTTLTVAAAFLEGIQLAFQVGLLNRKKEYNLFEKGSDEDRKHKRATSRLGNLNRAIVNYEQHFTVNYRPERPTFQAMVTKAEGSAMKILKPQIEEKIAEGELRSDEWVM